MYQDFFIVRRRSDGRVYTTLRDDTPQFVTDAVRAAHLGNLPNDWMYTNLAIIAEMMSDFDVDAIVDSLTDIYWGDLVDWLRTVPRSKEYVENAADVYDMSNFEGVIRLGQELMLRDMAETFITILA